MNGNNGHILIVDDDKGACKLLSHLMEGEGYKTGEAHDGETALDMIDFEPPDLLLVDRRLPDMDGMELIRRVKGLSRGIPVIMITGYPDIHGAVDAIKAGALDYMAKPFEEGRLIKAVHKLLSGRGRKGKDKNHPNHPGNIRHLREMMGTSEAIEGLISRAILVAGSDFNVIVMGESGSGKELIGRAIHKSSARARAPFIPVDCGAIPETLLESELFGHDRGAFTGADRQRPGKFEAAHGGTLFLDEISKMSLASQAKLLRAIQDRKIYRVGSNKPLRIDVRILSATNRDLEELVSSGLFRHDLFFRLNEFPLSIPPLRERRDDILYMARRFLNIANDELGKDVRGFSDSAIDLLVYYNWPGNVRQLRSVIKRAVLLADGMIDKEHLDIRYKPGPGYARVLKDKGAQWQELSLREILRRNAAAVEKKILREVLGKTGGNKARAARMLKIDYKTIHYKVKEYGIAIDKGVIYG